MPRMLYGTAWKAHKTAACVRLALELGFRGFDTACQPKHYHEPGVGDAVAAYLRAAGTSGCTREALYLQTKFTPLSGQDARRVPYDPHAALTDQVAQSLQTSLHNLQTGYVDCLVLHSPLQRLQDTITVWRAMEACVDARLVRQLGISNCYDPALFEQICQHAKLHPSVLQNRFYMRTGYDQTLRARCRERQIVYQSFWTLSANASLLEHAVVAALAREYARTPAQILFRYLIQNEVVPLTGTQSPEHMREDLNCFEFELSAQACDAITQLIAQLAARTDP